MKIIRTKRYQKDMKRLGATKAEIAALELAVASEPLSGVVIPGLRGIRKIRFGLGDKGKRGGGRAIYFLLLADDAAAMLFAYSKSGKTNLSETDRRMALAIIKELTDEET